MLGGVGSQQEVLYLLLCIPHPAAKNRGVWADMHSKERWSCACMIQLPEEFLLHSVRVCWMGKALFLALAFATMRGWPHADMQSQCCRGACSQIAQQLG